MKITRTGPTAFLVEFESEQEVLDEHSLNLSQGAFALRTTEELPADAAMAVTIRGPRGGATAMRARVVASLPDGFALAIEDADGDMLARLLSTEPASGEPEQSGRNQTAWDRLRELSQVEKIMLAAKADQTERAVLVQDNDPRVLLSLLRNPRLTLEEVARLSRSSFLNYQIADVIMKSPQWMASPEVRLGLIHNPKTPQQFALRILPTLRESELRAIARSGTSMQLKQAALRMLQKM
jgi:hypothetical protein